jgi:Protein of unknown function (DUF3551)
MPCIVRFSSPLTIDSQRVQVFPRPACLRAENWTDGVPRHRSFFRYPPRSAVEMLQRGFSRMVRQVMGRGCSRRRKPTRRRREMERNMKAVSMTIASAAALFALAFIALDSSPVVAAAAQQPESYCMALGEGGTDCGFTSFAQCQSSASGRNAVCFRSPSGNDEASFPSANGSQAPQVDRSRSSRRMRR